MTNATSRLSIDHRRTAHALAEHIVALDEIILGIDGLRALGDTGADALAAVLDVPEVQKLVLSWQLVETLAGGESVDIEAHLIEELGYDYATYVRGVLFPMEERPVPSTAPALTVVD